MRDDTKFYIDGAWLDATGLPTLDVINPATEKVAGRIALTVGSRRDSGAEGLCPRQADERLEDLARY